MEIPDNVWSAFRSSALDGQQANDLSSWLGIGAAAEPGWSGQDMASYLGNRGPQDSRWNQGVLDKVNALYAPYQGQTTQYRDASSTTYNGDAGETVRNYQEVLDPITGQWREAATSNPNWYFQNGSGDSGSGYNPGTPGAGWDFSTFGGMMGAPEGGKGLGTQAGLTYTAGPDGQLTVNGGGVNTVENKNWGLRDALSMAAVAFGGPMAGNALTNAGFMGAGAGAGAVAGDAFLPGMLGAGGGASGAVLPGLEGYLAAGAAGGGGMAAGGAASGWMSNPIFSQALKTLGGTAANALLGGGGGGAGGGNALSGLAGLVNGAYDRNQQNKAADGMLAYLREQQAKIDGLYNPGTPEYDALWQQMSRKDAAAGRNSQYGPRSVDLAAKIAEIKAGNTARMTGTVAQPMQGALNQRASSGAGIGAGLGNLLGGSGGQNLAQIIQNLSRSQVSAGGYGDLLSSGTPLQQSTYSNQDLEDMINGGRMEYDAYDFGGSL